MKIKYKMETSEYICFANNLEDIASSLQIPVYTVKHRIKNNKINIENVHLTLADIIQQFGLVSVDQHGIFYVDKQT